MLRIMIADDEFLVLESFKHIIERYTEGVEIVATASTGREAVELALRLNPDLIFMDIKMPGITGIEAIRSIREINKQTQFVIISAYEQFNFAREGIELGVLEYLTKPFSKELIISIISRVIESINEKHQAMNREIVLKEKLSKILPVIENQLIYSYLYHGVSFEALDFYEELFGINLGHGYMISLLIRDEIGENLQDSMVYSLDKQQFMTTLTYEMKSVLTCLAGPPLLDRLLFYVPVDPKTNPYDIRNQALEAIDKMLFNLEYKNTVQFQIGIGRIHSIVEMYLSYKESMAATKMLPIAKVVHIDDVSQEEDHKISYNIQIKERLVNTYLKGDYAELDTMLDELMMELWSQTDNLSIIKAKLMELIISLKKSDPSRDFGNNDSDEKFMHQFIEAVDRNAIKKIFYDYLSLEVQEVAKRKEITVNSVTAKALEFIQSNYGKNISLNDVAEHINMSYFYFSRLFKESTGSSFSDYLTEFRVEKSIELMEDEHLSVKEISYQIGYNDPNYFSKIFKKIKGVTPTEFRARLPHENNQ